MSFCCHDSKTDHLLGGKPLRPHEICRHILQKEEVRDYRNTKKAVDCPLYGRRICSLKGKCEIAGMKMEPFVRSLVDGCRIKPAPPDSYNKLRQQLSAIGNNLNQLTHVANATGRVSASQLDRAQSLLEDMWRCVRDSL